MNDGQKEEKIDFVVYTNWNLSSKCIIFNSNHFTWSDFWLLRDVNASVVIAHVFLAIFSCFKLPYLSCSLLNCSVDLFEYQHTLIYCRFIFGPRSIHFTQLQCWNKLFALCSTRDGCQWVPRIFFLLATLKRLSLIGLWMNARGPSQFTAICRRLNAAAQPHNYTIPL